MYLNHIQLKAARCVLNLRVRDIGLLIEVSRTTISKLENNIIKISEMRLSDRRNTILQEFFKKHCISFPNDHSIIFSSPDHIISKQVSNKNNFTRFQLRAARTALNKTQLELANAINVSPSIIKQAEKHNNQDILKFKDNTTIAHLLNIFMQEGIEFSGIFSIDFKKLVDASCDKC